MKNNNTQIEKHLPRKAPLDGDSEEYRYGNGHPYPHYGAFHEEEDGVNLREVLQVIRRRQWLIFAITAITTALTSIVVLLMNPWYSATTVIEIAKQNSMVLKSGEMRLNEDADPQYIVTVNTNKLVLESAELFEEVVTELKLTQNQEILEAVAREDYISYLSGYTKLIKPFDGAMLSEKEKTRRLKPIVDFLIGNTTIEQIKNARALKISFAYQDAELATRIVARIARVFVKLRFRQQNERFDSSAKWLSKSMLEAKDRVQKAEETLANYTRKKRIYGTDDIGGTKSPTLIKSKLKQLNDRFLSTRADRLLKQSLNDQVRKGRIKELPEVFTDEKIIELQKGLSEARSLAAELKVKFGQKHPKLIEATNQINTYVNQIENSEKEIGNKIRADYDRALKDEKALQTELEIAKSEALNEGQASVRYNLYKQEVETQRLLYNDLLQKASQASVLAAEQNSNIKVIKKAQIPAKPKGPKWKLMILGAFLVSLGCAVAFALLLEGLDETIKTIEDIERYGMIPILGVIPSIDTSLLPIDKKPGGGQVGGGSLSLRDLERNAVEVKNSSVFEGYSIGTEAYNSFRTSLLRSTAKHPPQTVLFTSTLPAEGKTTTVVNTAVSLTKLDLKTIIIDCDIRRPTIHKRLGIESTIGLVNYLSSNEYDLPDLVQKLSTPNLSAITSGQFSPNPTELLSSSKMKHMLEILSGEYDHIIIDAPPIISVADPIILGTIVDGVVLVVESGKPNRDILQRSVQGLLAANSNILGAVLNKVDLYKNDYGYYYNSHS